MATNTIHVGVGPLRISDHTEVLDVSAPTRLELLARARPLLSTRAPSSWPPRRGHAGSTLVEEPGGRLSRLVWNPILDRLVRVRNVEALRRLKRIAERQGRR